jgi:integrase
VPKRKRFTDLTFRNLKPRAERYDEPVNGRGLYATVQPSGRKRYTIRFRDPISGKTVKDTLPDGTSLAVAEKRHADAKLKIAQGADPRGEEKARTGAATNTLASIVARYYASPDVKKQASAGHSQAMINRNVIEEFGSRPIADIKRSELLSLYDEIVVARGERTADATLRNLGRVFNFWQLRDPDEAFRSPIVRGMSKYKPAQHARKRILSDDEIRKLRAAVPELGIYGQLLWFKLLTAARLREVSEMTWYEVQDGLWRLPKERNKIGEDLVRPLSKAALALWDALPRVTGVGYPFSLGDVPFNSFSRFKRKLDALVQFEQPFVAHDLRRTARSLLSRVGINSDVAELCLGHKLKGLVRQSYDLHPYFAEKQHAFEALAAELDRIISGTPADNVVTLRR